MALQHYQKAKEFLGDYSALKRKIATVETRVHKSVAEHQHQHQSVAMPSNKSVRSPNFASTPLKGAAKRVIEAENTNLEGNEVNTMADVTTTKLASTPLKGAAERVVETEADTAEDEERCTDSKAANSTKLASTPLKGAAERVVETEADNKEQEEENVEAKTAITTSKLASTPLKGIAERVAETEADTEEEEEENVEAKTAIETSKLASTPLKGAAKRVIEAANTNLEENEVDTMAAVTTTKLASTPLKGIAERVAETVSSVDEDGGYDNKADATSELLTTTPLNHDNTSTNHLSMPTSQSGAQALSPPRPPSSRRKSLSRTPLSGLPVRIPPSLPLRTSPIDPLLELLNTGDIPALIELPLIGQKRAESIMNERPFSSISDLSRIGLGSKQQDKISQHFNSSSQENQENIPTTTATSSNVDPSPADADKKTPKVQRRSSRRRTSVA